MSSIDDPEAAVSLPVSDFPRVSSDGSEHSLQSAQNPTMLSTFFGKGDVNAKEREKLPASERRRMMVDDLLGSPFAETFFALVVLADVIFACVDIDERARHNDTPMYAEIGSGLCLAVYSVQFLASLFARRMRLFRSPFEILNCCLLVSGLVEVLLQGAGSSVDEFAILQLLRIARTFRLARIIKKSSALSELRKLMEMIASCLKTLLWSFLACFMAMTIWSMMAVEFIHPLIEKLSHEHGFFQECADCGRSFSSVMRANLTIFKTVICGDSWGAIAVPVIEEYPATAIIFMGAQLSLLYGLLQLVVAVVVDSAAEFRERDVISRARELEADQETDLESLNKIFKRIDEDGDGELELKELIRGAETVPEFQSRLRVMDIDKADLEQLFHMLDEDKGNSISPDEFKYALSRWINDSKTAPRFAKYNTAVIMQEQQRMKRAVLDMSKKIDKISREMFRHSGPTGKPSKETKDCSGISRYVSGDSSNRTCITGSSETPTAYSQESRADEMGQLFEGTSSVPVAGAKEGQAPSWYRSEGMEGSQDLKQAQANQEQVVAQDPLHAAKQHVETCVGQSFSKALKFMHESTLMATEQAFLHLQGHVHSAQNEVSAPSNDATFSLSLGELGETLLADLHVDRADSHKMMPEGGQDEISRRVGSFAAKPVGIREMSVRV